MVPGKLARSRLTLVTLATIEVCGRRCDRDRLRHGWPCVVRDRARAFGTGCSDADVAARRPARRPALRQPRRRHLRALAGARRIDDARHVPERARGWRGGVSWTAFAWGLASAALLAGIGNLQFLLQFISINFPSAQQAFVNLVSLTGYVSPNLSHVYTGGYNYWDASRVLDGGYTINEFPYWSFLFADLHPHLIDISVSLAAMGLIFNLMLGAWRWPLFVSLPAHFTGGRRAAGSRARQPARPGSTLRAGRRGGHAPALGLLGGRWRAAVRPAGAGPGRSVRRELLGLPGLCRGGPGRRALGNAGGLAGPRRAAWSGAARRAVRRAPRRGGGVGGGYRGVCAVHPQLQALLQSDQAHHRDHAPHRAARVPGHVGPVRPGGPDLSGPRPVALPLAGRAGRLAPLGFRWGAARRARSTADACRGAGRSERRIRAPGGRPLWLPSRPGAGRRGRRGPRRARGASRGRRRATARPRP